METSWDPLQQPGECPLGENSGDVGFRALRCWMVHVNVSPLVKLVRTTADFAIPPQAPSLYGLNLITGNLEEGNA